MIVKTPAVTLAVEVRDVEPGDERLIMKGVASSMPCSVELMQSEILSLAGKMLRPSNFGFVLKALLFPKRDND